MAQHLLPAQSLDVLTLLQFQPQHPDGPLTVTALKLPPTRLPSATLIQQIKGLPLPSVRIMSTLKKTIVARSPGVESLAVIFRGKQSDKLPLWVITYWEAVGGLGEDFRWWRKARLERDQDPDASGLEFLSTIPWDGAVPTDLGARVWDLAGLATKEWLTGTQLDILGYLFNSRVKPTRRILKTTDGQALIHRYRAGQKSKRFETPPYLVNLGTDLKVGKLEAIGLCVNVNFGGGYQLPSASSTGNHWVGVVVDVPDRRLLFGDSEEGEAPGELLDMIRSWLKDHFDEEFTQAALPHTKQPTSWCCGDLAINMIAHYFNSKIPLVSQNPVGIKNHRWSLFRQVVNLIRGMVSQTFRH